MRDAISNKEDKVPVLGDIPILGALFRKTSKNKRKTNLLLILTPYIIRDPGDLREIFERKMQERQQMIDRYFVFGEDKFEPHIDYSRTRGLVSEIANEIDRVEDEIALAIAAELEPPPEHVPRDPVGSYQVEPRADEDTYVIGPNGIEAPEVIEPESEEPPEPDAAPAGAPEEAVEPAPVEPPDGAEPADEPTPDAPTEVIEPEKPSEPVKTADDATAVEPTPTNQGSGDIAE